MNCPTYHIPVMLQECIEGLNIKPDGIYTDMTFGGGGHSKEILRHLGRKGHLYGFDQDADAGMGAPDDTRFTFIHSNFMFLKNWMRYYEVENLDGIIADLGVSSHHLDEADRGFSFRYDAPLDMRMNRSAHLSAHDVIMQYTEEQLADVLYNYGEFRQSRRMASAIVKARQERDISTTSDLCRVVSPLVGQDREKKDLARLFQAIRIEVNGEMKVLKKMLSSGIELLKPGGRLVVMTYHSLEDRIVKNVLRTPSQGNEAQETHDLIYGGTRQILKTIGKNVITPSGEELAANPRSRSAKLRIAEKRQ